MRRQSVDRTGYNGLMRSGRIEWPTVAVAIAIAASTAATLAWHERLPVPLTFAALALIGAWYNSLQHEVVHGHPTPWSSVNTALASVPLGLVVPFSSYRTAHLAHHRTLSLTHPVDDPESFYVTADTWQRAGRPRRAGLVVLNTLAGRLVLGPPVVAIRWWWQRRHTLFSVPGVASTVGHLTAVAVVLFVVDAADLSLGLYVAGVVWGGGALTLLRSFAEHRAVDGETRSAVVRSNVVFSLLYLNNNLHHTHHARPRLAWYSLPRARDELGSEEIAARGAGSYRGYADIARRYLLRPIDHPAPAPIAAPPTIAGARQSVAGVPA